MEVRKTRSPNYRWVQYKVDGISFSYEGCERSFYAERALLCTAFDAPTSPLCRYTAVHRRSELQEIGTLCYGITLGTGRTVGRAVKSGRERYLARRSVSLGASSVLLVGTSSNFPTCDSESTLTRLASPFFSV